MGFSQEVVLYHNDTTIYTNYNCNSQDEYELPDSLADGHYKVCCVSDSSSYKILDAYYKNYKKDSIWIRYYPSGKINGVSKYINGKEEGLVVRLYENGNLQYKGNMVNDFMVGQWEWYYSNGNLKSINVFRQSSKIVDVSYYENGKIESITNYKNGLYEGGCFFFYKNGQLHSEGFFKADKHIGIWKYYSDTGELLKEINND